MRDAISHAEEFLADGRLAPGTPYALKATGPVTEVPNGSDQALKTIDRVELGDFSLTFEELAGWLKEMAESAKIIADYRPRANVTQ